MRGIVRDAHYALHSISITGSTTVETVRHDVLGQGHGPPAARPRSPGGAADAKIYHRGRRAPPAAGCDPSVAGYGRRVGPPAARVGHLCTHTRHGSSSAPHCQGGWQTPFRRHPASPF